MKKKDVAVGGVYIAKVSNRLVKVRITSESRFGGWNAVNLSTKREVRIRGAQRLRRRVDVTQRDVDAVAVAIAGVLGVPPESLPPARNRNATATTQVAPVATEPAAEAAVQQNRGDATLPDTVAQVEPQPTGQEGDDTMAKKKDEKGVIACSKCGRMIRLARQKKGGYKGRCECGQGYALGKRLLRVNDRPNGSIELPAAETVEQPKPPEPPARAPRERKDGKLSGLDAAAKVLADAGEPLGCDEVVKRMLEGGLWATSGKTPAATIYAAVIREIATKGDAARFRKVDRGRFTIAS